MGLLENVRLRNASLDEKVLYFEARILELQTEKKNHERLIVGLEREIQEIQAKIDGLKK